MSRRGRILLEKVCYHIVNRGNQKQSVFLQETDYAKYLEILRHYKKRYNFKLYAYCLMPNHIHLILEAKRPSDLAKIMQGLTLSYTVWFNKKYKKVGHLWQGRFKSMVIQKDRYLINCLQYIELNPVRAEIISRPEDYIWSSWKERILGTRSNPINKTLLDLPQNL